jgi:hypothetical protein
VKAYEGSKVNFVLGRALRCGGDAALHAVGAGAAINGRGSLLTDAKIYSALAEEGAIINALESALGGGVADAAHDGKSIVITARSKLVLIGEK